VLSGYQNMVICWRVSEEKTLLALLLSVRDATETCCCLLVREWAITGGEEDTDKEREES
jgi:uncharacterized protein affecting Mg2+/Co2+ transport